MTDAPYLQLWLDDARVGCGVRRFVNLTGPRAKKATLFYIPTLTRIEVDRRVLADAVAVELPTKAARAELRRRLRASVKEHKRLGLRVPCAQVAAALAALAD